MIGSKDIKSVISCLRQNNPLAAATVENFI